MRSTTMTRDAAGNVWETKTKTTGKVEVRIRYCCCCSLRVAAILIGIYTIIMYLIFLALAGSALSRNMAGEVTPVTVVTRAPSVQVGNTEVIIVDPYFDTLGLYTEETKFSRGIQFPVLIINIVVYTLLFLAGILVLVAVCTEIPWLVLPWIGMMLLDIIRGVISVILIFVYSGGDIRKIAVGIFFLGLQLFHMSLLLIMIAFFQWLLAKSKGQEFPSEQPDKKSVIVEGSNIYPTMPANYGYSNYAYSTSPHMKRGEPGSYPPSAGYATQPREPSGRFRSGPVRRIMSSQDRHHHDADQQSSTDVPTTTSLDEAPPPEHHLHKENDPIASATTSYGLSECGEGEQEGGKNEEKDDK